MRVPIIPFCPLRLSIRLPFEQCALHSVFSARCACTKTETNSLFARVYFFAVFLISSIPMSSSRLGPTDKHDGDAHMRKSSAGALQLGAALRLFPFASSFAVLKRIVFVLFTIFVSIGPRGGMSAWNSRSTSPMSTACASILPLAPGSVTWDFISSLSGREPGRWKKETLAYPNATPPSSCVNLCTSWLLPCLTALCRAVSREVRWAAAPIQRDEPVPCVQVSFGEVAQVPYVSQNFPICSLRVACSDTNLSRRVDSFFCTSILLGGGG